MASSTQCAAPGCSRVRKNRYHCEEHIREFQPRYSAYKDAERRLRGRVSEDLRNGDVRRLLQCYSGLREVYRMRSEYRERAFRREFWDGGHEFRLQTILEWMCEVERKLSTLFSVACATSMRTSTPETESEEEEDDVTDGRDGDTVERLEEIRRDNARIVEEERTWNELIPSMIAERNAVLKKREEELDRILSACRTAVSKNETYLKVYEESEQTRYYLTTLVSLVCVHITDACEPLVEAVRDRRLARLVGNRQTSLRSIHNYKRLSVAQMRQMLPDAVEVVESLHGVVPRLLSDLLEMAIDAYVASGRKPLKVRVLTNHAEPSVCFSFLPRHGKESQSTECAMFRVRKTDSSVDYERATIGPE